MKLLSTVAVLVFCVSVALFGCGLSDEEREAVKIPPEPTMLNWLPTDTITTVKEVKTVKGIPSMGYVIVERRSDQTWFNAAVVPFRKIPVGSTVKICKVQWESNSVQKMGPGFGFLCICD